jgi:hypothetical protein
MREDLAQVRWFETIQRGLGVKGEKADYSNPVGISRPRR